MEPAETEMGEKSHPSESSSVCQEPFHSSLSGCLLSLFLPPRYDRSRGTLHERLRWLSRKAVDILWTVHKSWLKKSALLLCSHCPVERICTVQTVTASSYLFTRTSVSTKPELFNQMALMRWTWKPFGKGTLIRMCVLNPLNLIKKLIKHLTI